MPSKEEQHIMKLVFMSNYLNHHQLPLAQNFVKIFGDDYRFIAMTPFNEKRSSSGWRDMNDYPFVIRAYESPQAMQYAIDTALHSDYLIVGGVPLDMNLVNMRAASNKITFEYTERKFKRAGLGIIRQLFTPKIFKKVWGVLKRRYSSNKAVDNTHTCILCAGAFVPADYKRLGYGSTSFYKWGYFTEVKRYDDIDSLISRKDKNSILWAGRFLDWKHPDIAVMLAKNLKAAGLSFRLKITGTGEMQDTLAGMVEAMNLKDCVELTGPMPPDQVRIEMEKAQIFLFTSDRYEGWGAVLNESMNSACAVVAGEHIGSVPYMLRHGHNGLIFRDQDIADLTEKVSSLLKTPAKISELGLAAYHTMIDEWSPEVVAQRFVKLAEALQSGRAGDIFTDGPCSPAPVLQEDWFNK